MQYAFFTTAVAVGISALESGKEQIDGRSTDNSSLYFSTFISSFLTTRALQTFLGIRR